MTIPAAFEGTHAGMMCGGVRAVAPAAEALSPENEGSPLLARGRRENLQMGYWEILPRSTSNLRDGVLVGRCALRLKTRVQDPVFGP